MNIIIPMLNLDHAVAGDLLIYRYDWQPLSYHLGAVIYQIFGSPAFILFLHTAFITLALSIIIFQFSRKLALPLSISVAILFMTPELFYTAVYFNSSAPAFLLTVLAFCLSFEKPTILKALLIGILCAVSIFLRLDFILILPFIFMFFVVMHKDLQNIIIASLSFLVFAIIILANEHISFAGIIDSYFSSSAEIMEKSGTGGWNRYAKNMTTTVIFSPLGWLFYGAGFYVVAKYIDPDKKNTAILLLLSLLPALIVMPDLLSVKYLMPAFVVLPFFAAFSWKLLADNLTGTHFRIVKIILFIGTALHLIVSIEPMTKMPFINVAISDVREIGTHDGPRTWGAYISQFSKVKHTRRDQDSFEQGKLITEALMNESPGTLYYVGEQSYFSSGAAGWRYAFLMLEMNGFKNEVIEKGIVKFKVGANELWLLDDSTKLDNYISAKNDLCIVIADEMTPDCLMVFQDL